MTAQTSFKFEMGQEVKDQVTGFVGFIVARIEHLTGCNTYWVQRKHKVNEDIKTSEPFDEVRLKATGKKLEVKLVQQEPKPGAMSTPKGAKVK